MEMRNILPGTPWDNANAAFSVEEDFAEVFAVIFSPTSVWTGYTAYGPVKEAGPLRDFILAAAD